MGELDFLKVMFLLPTRGKYAKPRICECIAKFSYFFFSVRSIMKVYINCCLLGKISYIVWKNSGS